jgi:UDP-N-acetyl-2-amino-2-deoxyglucuronate dehydrogenase
MLKFALIGCGRIAVKHAELLGKKLVLNAQLVSVCDSVEEKAKKIADQYGIPFYTDMDKMMQNEQVDVVVILTESGNHARNVIHLTRYGKDFIVEKPMALKLDDAEEMIRACAENNCKLFVVKQNRFNLPVVQLKNALEQGRFGKLVLGTVRVRWCRTQAYYNQDAWRGTWALDGGVLANQASHHVDLLQWLMGEVDSVYAKAATALAHIEAEDTAIVLLKFRSGALGIIEATTAARPKDLEGSISILGEKGTVEIGGFAVNEINHWNFTHPLSIDSTIKEKYSVNPPNVYGFGHLEYYNNVINSIETNTKGLIDGFEGKKSLELISAIYESIETKKRSIFAFSSTKM